MNSGTRLLFLAATIAAAATALALAGCAPAAPKDHRAVVVMSGGGAVSPFTTPEAACKTGLAAGNTDTAIREYLLNEGKEVYTAPASDQWGTVQEPATDSFGAFGDCPEVFPEYLTVMSTGDINASGERLARFVLHLNEKYGVTDVDFVGHSNGGLYSRAAIRILKQTEAPVTVRSLTMVGSPNEGTYPARVSVGELSIDTCMGEPFCTKYSNWWVEFAGAYDRGLNAENTVKYMDGEGGWNEAQAGYLEGIPVSLLAGTYFTSANGDPELWPNDGTVAKYSALAEGVSDAVIPHRSCWTGPLTHSIFGSNFAGLDWDTALTWNTDALKRINDSIDSADTALKNPTGEGCPSYVATGTATT
jgi:triacylglycerol lipase